MKIESSKYTGISGVYVSAIPTKESIESIRDFLVASDVPFSLDQFLDKAHMTLMYSRSSGIDLVRFKSPVDDLVSLGVKIEFWKGHDESGYVVLKLVSEPAKEVHEHLKSIDAVHSFDDYTPHVTIQHGINEDQVSNWIIKTNKILKSRILLIKFDTIKIEDCNQD